MYADSFRKLAKYSVEQGRERLTMTMGIVSHIEGDRYEIVAVSSKTGVFVAGEDFALKDTYCRDVFRTGETIALTEMDGHRGLQKHPLYEALPLEAYISAPILVNGKVWGTLNFSCMKVRDSHFSDDEVAFVESAAADLSDLLAAN